MQTYIVLEQVLGLSMTSIRRIVRQWIVKEQDKNCITKPPD